MSSNHNTLFLRLAGPMQAWGTSSRFQLRRTDLYPSKSGVLGMLLCAMGVRREDSRQALGPLTPLLMGVRIDRSGTLDWDYHTAGAKFGIRKAEGGVKETESTGKYETLLSRRQYLYDASFLVALHGDTTIIDACASALRSPTWPLFLGRKCCVPAEPIYAGTGSFGTLSDALASVPWRSRNRDDRGMTRILNTFMEHRQGSPAPAGARLVYDVPRGFGFYNYGPRWVVPRQLTVPVDEDMQQRAATPRRDPYGPGWDELRLRRLEIDYGLCVFCKSPAVDVHHIDYEDARPETLRSLCKICHDACTMLEYGHGRTERVDPSDPAQRPALLDQIKRLLEERRPGRQRELLKAARTA